MKNEPEDALTNPKPSGGGHSLLHLRDPRYGWLHYLLPPHEAQKLATFLQKQVVLAGTQQAPDKTN